LIAGIYMLKLLLIINSVLSAGVFALLMYLGEGWGFSLAVTFTVFVGAMLLAFVIMGMFEAVAMVFLDQFGALLARKPRKNDNG